VEDFVRILTEPKSSLVRQYTALLETEGLKLEFTPEAIAEMAQFAFRVNEGTENIGARRLHTIMEKVLDEISFSAPDLTRVQPKGDGKNQGTVVELAAVGEGTTAPLPVIERETANGTEKVMVIDPEYVRQMVADIVKNQDLSRYIL
jgi:ATP-dependent HslUV protease ATP-binding subunit HslU